MRTQSNLIKRLMCRITLPNSFKFCALNFLLLFCINISFSQVQDDLFYPLILDNKWIYEGSRSEEIIDTVSVNNHFYYGNGKKSLNIVYSWLRYENGQVYLFNHFDSTEFILFDFNTEINETWEIPSGYSCEYGNRIELVSKTDTVFTPIDTFYNCFHFVHSGHTCWDEGRLDTWIAPYVGKVRYRVITAFGNMDYKLSGYSVISSVNREIAVDDRNGILCRNYPNPFTSATTIQYRLLKPGNVSIDFYNINGQKVFSDLKGFQMEGYYNFVFEPEDLPKGLYIYHLKINKHLSGIEKLVIQ